tara:strand:- start:82 stop:747 length:666 start_codon:yes stop_codon:yes gene_type:complete
MQIQNGKIETLKLSTLEAEGITLQKMYAKEERSQRNAFAKSIMADGFNYRLGKLIFQLRSETDSKQLSQQRLKDCNLHRIDRRRRSEAEWFFNNHSDCMAHIKSSKKGFNSLTALQSSMKKVAKANETETTEGKVSNVGQSESDTEGKTQETKSTRLPKTEEELCKAIRTICDKTNLSVQRVLEILLEEEVPSVTIKEKGSYQVIGETKHLAKTGTDEVSF